MMSAEQGSFDVTTAMAGHLGTATVSAHSAMLNIIGLTFVSCPFAVGIAGSIRCGGCGSFGEFHRLRGRGRGEADRRVHGRLCHAPTTSLALPACTTTAPL